MSETGRHFNLNEAARLANDNYLNARNDKRLLPALGHLGVSYVLEVGSGIMSPNFSDKAYAISLVALAPLVLPTGLMSTVVLHLIPNEQYYIPEEDKEKMRNYSK